MDLAITDLEGIVRQDATYKDSLTLLGRAYYNKRRYPDAYVILQRALAVNKDDEIAWLVLGLAQLRLGQDDKAIETLRGALTLVSKRSVGGYRDFPDWDRAGLVRTSIQRAALPVAKGAEDKENIFRNVETLLARMDDEENIQHFEAPMIQRQSY